MPSLNAIAGNVPDAFLTPGGCVSPLTPPAPDNPEAPAGSGSNFRFHDDKFQIWNPDQSQWQTLYFFGVPGAESAAPSAIP